MDQVRRARPRRGKLQHGMALGIIGYVYFYLVLFALLANLHALKAVIFGSGSEAEYVAAVSRLQIFLETFVLPLVFTFLCMCFHALFFSRRFAAPIDEVRESISRIRRGDLGPRDSGGENSSYFQGLYEEMDGMVSRLRGDFRHFRALSRELAEEGQNLAATGNLPDSAREKLVAIANASSRLRQLADGYELAPEADEPQESIPVGL